jgi:hypothetical protein
MSTDVDYVNFKRRFDQSYAKLKLPPDCVEQKSPTVTNVRLFSWMFDWVLVFPDDKKYVRIRESHDKVAGLALSRRLGFVLHYGPIVHQDADGNIIWQSHDPVDIRIDNSPRPVHMHYQAPDPHHVQENVKGLTLESLDMLTFVRAVFQHRKSGKPLNEVLGFQIG